MALGFNVQEAASIGIIGGADGPTSIFTANKLAPHLIGPIAVAAYTYMSLVPLIQPPIMTALTTDAERKIRMKSLRPVGKLERILFAIIVMVIVCLVIPPASPLIAMLMLLWTSNWMLNKSSVEAWNRYIRKKTEAAVADAEAAASADNVTLKTVVSLAMLSFLAVFREGAETVIFYESIYTMSRDTRGMWIGGLTAAVVLVGIFLLFRFTSVKIPIGPFFLVTSILMSVLVVVFAGGGVHSLIEGDALPATYLQGVPTNDWLGFYPYVECIIAQVIAAIAVIALFVVGFIKQRKAKAKAAVTAGAPNNQPNNL